MAECIFCKIVNGELDSEVVYDDETAVAFKDISPQAPHHVLVIPRQHIPSVADAGPDDEPLLGHLCGVAARLAEQFGLAGDGYRLVINCGAHGGQAVDHLHVHLLGGRQLTWPPG
ncbi:MAG: histidine triad nucleotide-binding protein [Armatimonadota bacterium]